MRSISGFFPALAGAALLAGCMTAEAPPATTNDFRPIATEAAFRNVVQNGHALPDGLRVFFEEDSYRVLNARDELTATGRWSWSDGQYCREGLTATGRVIPRECQQVEASATEIRYTRPDGSANRHALLG